MEQIEVLVWQYRECLSNIRIYDSLIWQIPSITMAINTFLGILYLGYAKTFVARMVVLIASFIFTLVATIALRKHRFFQEAITEDFEWIQEELLKQFKDIRRIKLRTEMIYDDHENYKTVTRCFLMREKAYRWLLGVMIGSLLIIFILIIIEIILFYLSYSITIISV